MSVQMFEDVKNVVSALDVWNRYGETPVKAGFVRCIYHDDKKPSMKLYDGTRGFYCFSCQAGGDAIKLAGSLLGLSPAGTLRRLSADFCLGINIDRQDSNVCAGKENELRTAENHFEEWRAEAFRNLCEYHRVLCEAIHSRPRGGEVNLLEQEAYREIDKAAYFLDCLEDEPMKVYKTSREYVSKIAHRVGELRESDEVCR